MLDENLNLRHPDRRLFFPWNSILFIIANVSGESNDNKFPSLGVPFSLFVFLPERKYF